jgi:hypothetical protein
MSKNELSTKSDFIFSVFDNWQIDVHEMNIMLGLEAKSKEELQALVMGQNAEDIEPTLDSINSIYEDLSLVLGNDRVDLHTSWLRTEKPITDDKTAFEFIESYEGNGTAQLAGRLRIS